MCRVASPVYIEPSTFATAEGVFFFLVLFPFVCLFVVCVCVCSSLSLSLFLSLSLPPPPSLSLSLFPHFHSCSFLSHSPLILHPLSLSLPPPSIPYTLYLCVPLSVCLCLSVCLPVCLSVCILKGTWMVLLILCFDFASLSRTWSLLISVLDGLKLKNNLCLNLNAKNPCNISVLSPSDSVTPPYCDPKSEVGSAT